MSNNWYWQFLQQNISNICVTHCKSAANFLIKMSDQCYWFANFLQKKCFCRVIRLILASFAKNILATFVSHCALVRQIFLEKCLINAFDLLISDNFFFVMSFDWFWQVLIRNILAALVSHCAHVRRIFLENVCVTIMCHNDELSSTMSWVGCSESVSKQPTQLIVELNS